MFQRTNTTERPAHGLSVMRWMKTQLNHRHNRRPRQGLRSRRLSMPTAGAFFMQKPSAIGRVITTTARQDTSEALQGSGRGVPAAVVEDGPRLCNQPRAARARVRVARCWKLEDPKAMFKDRRAAHEGA